MNLNPCQMDGLVKWNGDRLIPSLQPSPMFNYTIRICQRATRLVFAHSRDEYSQMACRDIGQSRKSNLLRTRSPPHKRRCCHLSWLTLSLQLYLDYPVWVNTCMWLILPQYCIVLLLNHVIDCYFRLWDVVRSSGVYNIMCGETDTMHLCIYSYLAFY